MANEDDFKGFVKIATENIMYDVEKRFKVLPKKYQEELARNLISGLKAHPTKRAADAAQPSHVCNFENSLYCPVCGKAQF